MSSSEEREIRLKNLDKTLGHSLNEDIKLEEASLRTTLSEDFDKEIEVVGECAKSEDLFGVVYHRFMANMIHTALKSLEMNE
jgi:hypothetical protein